MYDSNFNQLAELLEREPPEARPLADSEARYRSLFEHMLDGFAYCEMLFDDDDRPVDFIYLAVNGAFERLTGLKDVVGKRVTEVIPGIKEANPELFEIYGRVALTGKPETFEFDFKLMGVWLSISVYSTEPEYFVAVFDNVTDRKRAEEELAAAVREWTVFFDAMVDGVSLHGPDHTILNANQSLCQMLGKSKEEMIGKKCYQVFHDKDAPILGCPLEQSRQTLCKENAEFFEPSLNKWLAASTSPVFDDAGRLVRLVHVIRDITDRKRTEDELRETQRRAVAANQAKSQFLANMSHEIRTPMTAILGFTDLLMTTDLSEKQRREFLETIARNGRSLLDLINDILDLSKIEAEKMSVESVDCRLPQLIDDVLKIVQVRAQDKGLGLEVDYGASLPETIHTDPTRLRQILLNLVGNAIKFTERGGVRISIQNGRSRQGSAQMQFSISDTGIGIEPENLGEIFQPFTQADASTTRRFGGTGLGLAISKRLANLLGGDIEVQSELGRGSTFTVTVDVGPAKKERAPSGATALEQAPESATRARAIQGRVLLAEDAADLQGLLSQVLRAMNLEIELAGNGRSACEKAAQSHADEKPFDLILMDVQMPEKDGLEAARWLRGHGWRGPIIALTAHAMPGDREKCLAAGCDDYLAKTASLRELRAIVARHLHRTA